MKYLQQTVQSSFFLFGGVLVLAFSLHFTHVDQTRAASTLAPSSSNRTAWMDANMPGTMPYLVNRVSDKIEMLNETTEASRAEVAIAFAEHRLKASQYAFSLGEYDSGINTLTKSFGYLAQAHMLCEGFAATAANDCQALKPVFTASLQNFIQSTESMKPAAPNENVRMQMDRLIDRAQVFSQ